MTLKKFVRLGRVARLLLRLVCMTTPGSMGQVNVRGQWSTQSTTMTINPVHAALQSAAFDPSTNSFTNIQNMTHGRWYPTLTTLGDGRVMTFSGVNETGSTNTTVEIYTIGKGWSTPTNSGWTPPLYPRMHL